MATPEGIVLEKCIKLLKVLELQGYIKHFERMNVGLHINMSGYYQRHGTPGMSDLIAFVPVDLVMWVMFFEVKRAEGGIQSTSQKEFENKFLGFTNIVYAIITDSKQIKEHVFKALMTSPKWGILDQELPDMVG